MTASSNVDERSLREIYLASFEQAVKKAKPWTIMGLIIESVEPLQQKMKNS